MSGSAYAALNRLAKWRTLLAGWQLGTRPKGDPECDAVRDHREVTLLLRAEVTALTGLLIDKGVFTAEEFAGRVGLEADLLSSVLADRFPGVTATDNGLIMDARVVEWMSRWRP